MRMHHCAVNWLTALPGRYGSCALALEGEPETVLPDWHERKFCADVGAFSALRGLGLAKAET